MVVSSACMMTARITQAVIAPRLAMGCAPGADAAGMAASAEPARQETGKAARVAGVDAHLDAHADPQRRLVRRGIDFYAHGDALNDLDPIARRVLRRQQREARTRRRADAV